MSEFLNLISRQRDFLLGLVWDHIWISGLAILLALILGVGLGILISFRRSWASLVIGLVNVLYTVPSIALLGILISITGIGNKTAIIALTLYALLPMVRATYTGITGVEPLLVEAAEGMGSTRRQILTRIQLPLAFPVMMSGFRNMVTMTIALAGIASFVGAGGLGVAIYRGITTNSQALTLAGSLLVALLALFFDFLLAFMERSAAAHRTVLKKWGLGLAVFLLLAAGALAISQMAQGQGTIKIATKPQTENYILGEMQKQVIEEYTDLKAEMTKGVGGGTSNIHPAMVKGDFDIYAEYTGTIWEVILKKEGSYDESQFQELSQIYQQDYSLVWASSFGFNNTYGLAVRKEIAEQYNLKTYSDLAKAGPNLTFGAEYDFFGREDGFAKLEQTYGMKFKSQVDMDSGLKYQAIQSGQVDVMDIFTTDGQLYRSGLVVLEDDKKMYPSYRAGTVVREETLEKYPQLKEALAKLDGILDDSKMAELNHKVET
ncbi:glycine betaine ABC transporter substrate-binding protein, partial [Streptococcus sp. DD11]|uniref:ABC transporter permease/substrate-binding protein n=1 Tax=Streptococcus sp. DD11 TaxID=1777879 RepID=UPI0010082168